MIDVTVINIVLKLLFHHEQNLLNLLHYNDESELQKRQQ